MLNVVISCYFSQKLVVKKGSSLPIAIQDTMNEEVENKAVEPEIPKPPSRRAVKWVLALAILTMAFLATLPVGIKYGVARWLESNGAQQVKIENVDFNLFAGKVSFHNLKFTAEGRKALDAGRLSLGWDWLPLFSKRVHINEIEIENLTTGLAINDSGLDNVAGIAIGPPDKSKNDVSSTQSPWEFGIDRLTLVKGEFDIKTPKFEALAFIDSSRLEGLASWDPQKAAHINLVGRVNKSPVSVEASINPFGNQQEGAMKLEVRDFPLKLLERLAEQQLDMLEGSVNIKADTTFVRPPNGANKIKSTIDFTVTNPYVKKDDISFGSSVLVWRGLLHSSGNEGSNNFSAEGVLQGESIDISGGDKGGSLTIQDVELSGLSVDSNKGAGVAQADFSGVKLMQITDGGKDNVGIEKINLIDVTAGQDKNFSVKQLSLGDIDLQQTKSGETGRANIKELSITGLTTDPESHINIEQIGIVDVKLAQIVGGAEKNLGIENITVFDTTADQDKNFSVKQVSLETIKLDQSKDGENDHVNIKGVALFGVIAAPDNHFNVDRVGIEGVKIGEVDPELIRADGDTGHVASVDHTTISHIQVATLDDIVIKEVSLDGVKVNIKRENNGHTDVAGPSGNEPVEKSGGLPATASPEAPSSRSIKIGVVTLDGTNEVWIDDSSIQPALIAVLKDISARVENLDSAAKSKPSPIKLQATLNEYTKINIDGSAALLAKSPDVKLTAQISSLDMMPLSPYVSQSIGYGIMAGQADASIDMVIEKKKIDSDIKVEIRKLDVASSDKELVDKFAKQISMPLPAALSLLRDKYGNIILDFKLSGDLDAPEFSLAEVINHATASAMKKGALAYLTLFMQPYGAMIALADMAGDELSRVRLDPVPFAPGSANIDGDAVDYIKKVASLMKERPELRIHIGGVAVSSDRDMITEATRQAGQAKDIKKEEAVPDGSIESLLEDLAQKRAEAVKEALVKTHSDIQDRLIISLPEVETGKSKPRADLMI